MKEAVVGAAVGTSVDILLRNLLSFTMEEIGLFWNLNKDLKKLKQSVRIIRDFLDDADLKQLPDKSVNRWLKKLEAVAFDADFVFDQLNYEVLRKKVEADDKMNKRVRSFLPSFDSILFRRRMAGKINDITKELESINQEARDWGLPMRLAGAQARGAGNEVTSYLESDSFTADPIFVGRENDVTEVVEMVSSIPTEQVIISVLAIVGMGGLGKTTLTRKVFNDAAIISQFGKRIWVHVSENFDPVIVLKKTLESLTGENVDGSKEVVSRKLREKIGDERFLLVLDNVWNEDRQKWENFITSLEGISPRKGNVIMLTTRKGNVASIVKTLGIHELGVVSEDDCWSIIKSKAFERECECSEFDTIGKNIAKRCGGLPLAAQVAGSFLRGKSKAEWDSMDFGVDGDIVSNVLKLSFNNLPSPSLKMCFAICSIVPKDMWLGKRFLINLWMAEGLLQNDDKEKDMEIFGNKFFNILVQSSLLQVCEKDDYGNIKWCSMHDLVHDLALSVVNPKFLDDSQVRYISYESSPVPKEHAQSLRALCISGEVSKTMVSNLERLHVLILLNENIKELPTEIGELISLRFLHITDTSIEYLPDSIGNLCHLQTLFATIERGGRTFLRRLPDTVKYLISLRHLGIPNIKLPPQIGKLVSLQTLPFFQVGDEDGCGIMELGSLKNLRGEIEIHNLEKVLNKEEAKSADLFHKPNILKLKLVWNESGEGERTNDENVLEGLQPHSNLKKLEINGFQGKSFPPWTFQMAVREESKSHWVRLDKLFEIKLVGCKHCEEIPMLGQLPNLKSLSLHHLTNVKSLGSSFYGIQENGAYHETVVVFPALGKLELIGMTNLTAWDEVEFATSSESQPRQVSEFGRLEYLKITDCRQLKSAPSNFPCLKELEIDNMESDLPLANICESKLTSLSKLRIERVDGLMYLPDELFHNNRDLLELEIRNCNNLTRLVQGLGASFRKLVIWKCLNFAELPEDLHSLTALEKLRVFDCPNLKSIAYYPSGGGGQLSSQGGFTSLRKLEMSFCSSVTNLPIRMIESCVSSLEWLLLSGSKSITNLPQVMSILPRMPRLTALYIAQVPKSNDVATEIVSVRSLTMLGIGPSSDCRDYISFKASLDRIFPALQYSLRELELWGMEQWDALPDQLQHLTTLQGLRLIYFGIEALPDWLGNLSSLTVLNLLHFAKLRCLPSKEAMHGLTKLTEIRIEECPLLKQNLPREEASYDDSEWPKISHIPTIELDGNLISSLQLFQVGDENGCGIMELGSLKNLRGKTEIRNLEKVLNKEEAKSADLFHKPNILKLKLVWNECGEGDRTNDENVLEGLQPHSNLKELEINGFQGRSFPPWTFQMAVREEFESHWVRLDKLFEIKLVGCKHCEEIPMLGQLPNLKSLSLHHLTNVKSLGSSFYGIQENGAYHETVVVFPALGKLELIGMTNLTAWDEVEFATSSESQPRQVSEFGRLEYLKITDCRQLKSAPSNFPCLKELEIGNMESDLPLAIICGSKLTTLSKLRIERVDGLRHLPYELFNKNRDLLELEIRNCNNLTHLVQGLGASLRNLVIWQCLNFAELPEDLHSLTALEELTVFDCPNLKSIAYYPSGGDGQLSSQGGFTSLRKLEICFCDSVTNLPIQMIESCASSLESLFLNRSMSITNLPQVMSILPQMPRLTALGIAGIPKSNDVAAEIGSVRSLASLGIGPSPDCRDYVSFKASLDRIFPALQYSLCELYLWGMEQWDALPDQLQHLTTLQVLRLIDFGIEALPDWLGNLSSLTTLGLYNLLKLRCLPSKDAMHGLTKLTEIGIENCPLLKQNLPREEASYDDSEWPKISHIPTIKLDGNLISVPAQ